MLLRFLRSKCPQNTLLQWFAVVVFVMCCCFFCVTLCYVGYGRHVYGLVVYAGCETRIQKNAARPPLKIGSFDLFLSIQVFGLIVVQVCVHWAGVKQMFWIINCNAPDLLSQNGVLGCKCHWLVISLRSL